MYDAYNHTIGHKQECGTLIAHHGQQIQHIVECENEKAKSSSVEIPTQ